MDIEVENTAPHWHLVENGHEVKADPAMYAAYRGGRLDHSKSKRTAKSRSKNPKLQKMAGPQGLDTAKKRAMNGKMVSLQSILINSLKK